ncbi:30S ribosomal protein S12 methylthiotransferase RimO [Heliorestis convoluta]|uniref:Ribosomal protein uS12 methylthiotransferase RimO n=1 Tax=Heliorestis convoluta TaxID=356322 RepID=A0A5Q2MZP9_9FIRM|nr:30S ribosomal protein S12 methylthiotransferase RimO [Heliorestis convoluta]QGG46923.1 ribosomal protein S12 methylthiotransferase RimO [Heliorestis convoluta]
MAIKVNITSLGCAKNRVDTEVMMGILRNAGYDFAHREEDAEVHIVNTCGFILPAKEESIGRILELAALKQTGPCRALLVAGCLSQGYSSDLAKELPEVDIFLGPGEVPQIADLVAKALSGQKLKQVGQPDYLYDHNTPRLLTTPFHYGYLKVADGCDNQCSYCSIPSLRGSFRSRSEDSIIAEAQTLLQRGVQEILLIAQDTTRYGLDRYGSYRLPQLLKKFKEVEGLQWLRLMYCYPNHFTPQIIEAMAADPRICKYVDLPLQHSHDDILQAMNRRGTQKEIKKLIQSLREQLPGIAIRSTFIVGFPGEEEEHFQALLEFMEEMRFDRVGVFTYSQEERTPAGKRHDQIPEEVKEERFHRAMALQQEISLSIQKEWIGKTVKVLIEEEVEPGRYRGRSEREAPEVDGFIEFSGTGLLPGQWAAVKITAAEHYDLIGEVLHESGQ